MRGCHPQGHAFTLAELLVVIAVVATLLAIMIPLVRNARDESRKTACVSNLRQIGIGIAAYAADHDGKIPYGPAAQGFNNAGNFYPSTGAPTSLISLQDGSPVALGLLIQPYLSDTSRVLFCPGSDQELDAGKELAKVGKDQAQSSYYYRHGGNTALYDNPRTASIEPPLRLGNLGENRRGQPIRALVIDTIFLCPPSLAMFGVRPFSNHRGKTANILFSDGHVASRANADARFSVDSTDQSQIRNTFSKILDVFETADEEP